MLALGSLGVDFPTLAQDLEDEGVRMFADSFDKALESIAEKRRRLAAA